MKYKVVIEQRAQSDLFEILAYISEILYEPVITKRIYKSIKEQILSLKDMPNRYAVVTEEPYCSLYVRKMPMENYCVFYIVDEEIQVVHVLRILYNRREWQKLL